jgi:hypothetical protein
VLELRGWQIRLVDLHEVDVDEEGLVGMLGGVFEELEPGRLDVFVHERNGKMEKWTAEMFFPYKLLAPLGNIPPTKGTYWNEPH